MNCRRFAALMLWTIAATVGSSQSPGDDAAKAEIIDGLRVHRLSSPYQPGETEVLVLLPDVLEPGRRYPLLFVLPVEAGRGAKWGDGLAELRKANLHNQHQLICVTPTFAQLPWYADHPTDPLVRQESHLLQAVLPLLEREYPQARHEREGRLLLGFSKSGWGAWSLLLRHPDVFNRAAAWDAPLMLDAPGKYGSGPIFGTAENFAGYHLPSLLRERAAGLGASPRLIHLAHGNFRNEQERMESLLVELQTPHVYIAGPRREHHWGSGWLPEAVAKLVESERPKPE